MGKLSGRVAVVTGASKGIGASIAEHLAAEGASVVVNYATSKSAADAVVSRITSKGGKAIAVQGNVALPQDIDRLFTETKKAFGKLDILVNNAGIYEFAPLDQITREHVQKHFDLNVTGLLLTTKEAVKLMGPEGGSIVNIGSIVGPMPAPQASTYSASKAAVDAITVSLASELGPRKIRVNSLNPGMVETDGLRASGLDKGEFREQQDRETPLGRIAQPEDIALAAVFLAGDDARWITGQVIIAAGGKRM
jgi:3-oxoacyl-[acyl-carrier protein] reductase